MDYRALVWKKMEKEHHWISLNLAFVFFSYEEWDPQNQVSKRFHSHSILLSSKHKKKMLTFFRSKLEDGIIFPLNNLFFDCELGFCKFTISSCGAEEKWERLVEEVLWLNLNVNPMARLQLKGQIHLVTVKERTDNGRERERGQSIRTCLFGDVYLIPYYGPVNCRKWLPESNDL